MESLLIIPMLIVFYDLFKLVYNIFLKKKAKKFLLTDLIMIIIIFFMTFTIFILPNLLVHLVLYFNRRIYSVFIIIMTIIDMMLAWGSLYLLGIVSFIIFILFHVGIYLKIKERNEELNNYMYLALAINDVAIILGSITMLNLAS